MVKESGFQVSESGPQYYDKYVRVFMAPFVEHLMAAAVQPNQNVLDVACGTGFATRRAAACVGPDGAVIGSDINTAMLSLAKTSGETEGAAVRWQEASALNLPFEDDTFDAVICQQGVQFFPDPSAGLKEMARVAKPGAQIAATVWAPRVQSPYLDAVIGVLERGFASNPAAAKVTCVEAGEAAVQGWFKGAGMAQVTVATQKVDVALPPFEDYVDNHIRAIPPVVTGTFWQVEDAMRDQAFSEMRDVIAAYQTASGYVVPFTSYVATAQV
ncbi:class I SAM-dependent methyltransferase [Shimia sagamensis]|uniref:Methyltransferase domain-containing protein n=1 Tax=Shimia sagamensis TaxID=1566352 RepID=A0ABY1P666_9RHOB|nr:methyltransferase domain-containing protein [Shimia sagamensis]SMP27281.1 Methyltransferase domain-containing protein [Shimia sagamensis]